MWVDAQGAEVNPEGAIWKPIQLTGRETKGVQSLAPNPSAVDVVVYLKNKRLNMNAKLIFAVLAATTLVSGCASTGAVSYGDAQAVETLTTDFGSTDLQMIAAKMVDDMLMFPPIVQMTQNRRPVIVVDRIHNKTQEHIDTESITDSIQNKLINSGKFRFVDMKSVNAMAQQLAYQNRAAW